MAAIIRMWPYIDVYNVYTLSLCIGDMILYRDSVLLYTEQSYVSAKIVYYENGLTPFLFLLKIMIIFEIRVQYRYENLL